MRPAAWIGVAVLVAACPGTTPTEHEPPPTVRPVDAGQPEYAFPGCSDEDGPACPNSATARCAVEFTARQRGYCAEDFECDLVWLKPRCLGVCDPYGVGFEEVVELKSAMQYEVDRYCAMGPCAEAACPDAGGVRWVPSCHMGFCAAVRADAGTPDAGSADPEDASAPDA